MLVLVQRPQHKSTPDPVAAPKNIKFGTIFIEFGDTKKCCTFSGLEISPRKRTNANWRSQLHAQRSQTHSIPLGPSEKIPFVQNHKEGAICAILREKPHFGAFAEAIKGVVNCARLRNAAHWPNNNANPSGTSEKNVYCVERRDMCDTYGKNPIFGLPRG